MSKPFKVPEGVTLPYAIEAVVFEMNNMRARIEKLEAARPAPRVRVEDLKCQCVGDYTGLPHTKDCPIGMLRRS